MTEETTKQESGMDPTTAALIGIGLGIVDKAIKYGGDNIDVPTAEALGLHLQSFKAMLPLPETFDEDVMDKAEKAWDAITDIFGFTK
jgi:hypothetical protein